MCLRRALPSPKHIPTKILSRNASSSTNHDHIVVLGAGISGLTAAFHLRRRFPDIRITVLDEQNRAGGWIQSDTVDLGPKYGRVLLEAGPRTLRPVSRPLLELVHLLNLESELIITPKSAPAATKRFLCLSKPDGQGLKALPSSPLNMFFSPFFFTLLRAVLTERYWPPNRTQPIPVDEEKKASLSQSMKVYDDESVDSFLTRRFGPKVARLFGSALVHGIYAGDSRRLSVRAAFPSLWDAEDRGKGSVITGIVRTPKAAKNNDELEVGNLPTIMSNASVFSFKNGLSTISSSLLQALAASNVSLSLKSRVVNLRALESGVKVQLEGAEFIEASHVVSALPLPRLDTLLPTNQRLPHLSFNPRSNVKVINLVFPCKPTDIHPEGFGYLIPRPADGYDNALSNILGVVFDSCALAAQDQPGQNPITKLTLMCGGPYATSVTEVSLDNLIDQLFSHLSRPRMEPIHVREHDQKECIPLPLVGHLERMKMTKRIASEAPWNGRLQIIGADVDGAGIADCVKAGRVAAFELARG